MEALEIDLETVLVLDSTGKLELATLEGWIPQNPSWLAPREYKIGLVKRVGDLILVSAEKI